MEYHDICFPPKGLLALLALQQASEDHDTPPRGWAPRMTFPGPLSASIVFPLKLVRGGRQ
jgi:hypothetical protein